MVCTIALVFFHSKSLWAGASFQSGSHLCAGFVFHSDLTLTSRRQCSCCKEAESRESHASSAFTSWAKQYCHVWVKVNEIFNNIWVLTRRTTEQFTAPSAEGSARWQCGESRWRTRGSQDPLLLGPGLSEASCPLPVWHTATPSQPCREGWTRDRVPALLNVSPTYFAVPRHVGCSAYTS